MNARLRAAILARRRRGVPGAGAPHPRRADGYEFAELREYQAGDDPRRIDWAATARAGGLQTRVMFEDHALVLAGALDASRSMLVGRERTVYDLALDDRLCPRLDVGADVLGKARRHFWMDRVQTRKDVLQV